MIKSDGSLATNGLRKVPGASKATVDLMLGAIATAIQLCAQEAGDVAPDYETRIHDRVLAAVPSIVDSAMDNGFTVSAVGAKSPQHYKMLQDKTRGDPIASEALVYGQRFKVKT